MDVIPIQESMHATVSDKSQDDQDALLLANLRHNIATASMWTIAATPEGLAYRPRMVMNTNFKLKLAPCPEDGYTEEQLSRIDTRLPLACRAMMRTGLSSSGELFGAHIRASLRLWEGELITIPSQMFALGYFSEPFIHIAPSEFSLSIVKYSDGTYGLSAEFIKYTRRTASRHSSDPEQNFDYIHMEMKVHGYNLSPAWLDVHRNGWDKLVLSADTLDLGIHRDELASLLKLFDTPAQTAAHTPPSLEMVFE